eukprot:g12501.t1
MFYRARWNVCVWIFIVTTTGTHAEFSADRDAPAHPIEPSGILFFGYGHEESTANHFLRQAYVSARRIKALNPTTNITVVCNPGVTPEANGVFDMVINIDEKYLYDGKVQQWGPQDLSRQWLTRIEYLPRSPYEVTLALDSQALCCTTDVDAILRAARWEEFDISFAVQSPHNLGPHNWAIMYRLNFNTRRLFQRWINLQIAYSRRGSDQLTLHMAAGSLALQGKLNVGVLSENVALATVVYGPNAPEYPKTSTLVDPRPVYFVHYDAMSHEDEESTCEKLNRRSDRARVVVLPKPFPKSTETKRRLANIYELVYSGEELAAAIEIARKGTPFFRRLDWDNAQNKWGHVATPWRHHYPGCWEHLDKEVNKGIRQIYGNPGNIWDAPGFADEFRHDHLDWRPRGPSLWTPIIEGDIAEKWRQETREP